MLRDPGFGFCKEPPNQRQINENMSKRFNFFWLKPSNPFAFYLTFLSEKFWHITCNPQIISTRCTQNANMFFSFTQHTLSNFSVVASLVFTPLNGLRNEGDHKRCRYQGGQNMQKCKQKTHKTKGKTWWSTKLHTTNHRL